MPKRQSVIQVGRPIIRTKLREVTPDQFNSPEIMGCISTMVEANITANGVGISANQVGYNYRISVIHIRKTKNRPNLKETKPKIMINPKFISLSPATEYMWEGCLSVAKAGLFCKVKRHKSVKITYQTQEGKSVTETLNGMEAHIAQHELDHLDGKIFLDHTFDKQSFMSSNEYRKMRRAELKTANVS